jgi:hypothetical protein
VPNLSNVPALDAVIGLAFVYFVLSLVISSVTEAISAVFQVRWKKLDQGLRELFLNSGGDAEQAKKLWEDFRKNDRIRALWKQTGKLGPRGPSYIPPRVLALTLLDTLAPPSQEQPVANPDHATAKGKEMARDHDLVKRAERAAGSVHNPLLRKWLLDALTELNADRETILDSLEASFDSVTNRVSGWYKRYATIIVAVLGFAAAGALNVDSYAIGSRLWKDDAVRTAISSQAASLNSATCPKPANKKAKAGNGAQGSPNLTLERATDCVSDLRALSLPIGWAKENRPETGWAWAGKALGMIVTGFALMLGAPFWFDTLSKLARLRTSGVPEGTAKRSDKGTAKGS